jgi:spermidine/putrescine transport system substrate-binding protein
LKNFILIALFLIFPLLHGQDKPQAPTPTKRLRVLNWSYYIDLDKSKDKSLPIPERSPSLSQFAREYDCQIEYYEYHNIVGLNKFLREKPKFFDVIITSHGEVENLLKKDKLATLPKEELPNLKNIAPAYSKLIFDPEGKYFVPYLVGATGLIYRTDMIKKPVESWSSYFKPSADLKGKLGMFNIPQTMIPLANIYLDQDANTQDPKLIKKTLQLLENLKKRGFFGLISSDPEEIKYEIINGKIAISPFYSGDAQKLIKENSTLPIGFCIPAEGGEFYIDCFVILKNAPEKELAVKFINFMISPKVHASVATYLQYTCPNLKSIEIIKSLAPEQLKNPSIYFPEKTLNKLQFFNQRISPETENFWKNNFKNH